MSDTPRTDDEFSDAIKQLDLRAELAEMRQQRDEALERWMDQVTAMLCHSMTHSHDSKQELVTRCDKAIDAMRKGEV